MSAAYSERALIFECAGEKLVGIVTSRESARVGVLVVVGGPQYRIGSHRQFLLLARKLAERGIAAMRFDYRGMGDSSGRQIHFEEAVPDVGAAIDAFETACPALQGIVLWCLCDGASLALMYCHATRDRRVAGLVLADPWITSEAAFAESQARHYLRRPFQREFWLKVIRGGVDFKGALADVRAVLGKLLRPRAAPAAAADVPFQDRMARGMHAFAGPILLVLSGDLTARDFVQYCETHREWQPLVARPNVDRRDVPGANHTFASAAARAEVEDMTVEWLLACFAEAGSQ